MVWACTSSDVVLVGEASSGLYFNGPLCRVSLYVQLFVTFSFRVLLFFVLVVFFSKVESFVLGLSFDFFVVFKRIIYPVLIWVQSGLGTVGLSCLVMLLVCDFVALVGCVGQFSLLL